MSKPQSVVNAKRVNNSEAASGGDVQQRTADAGVGFGSAVPCWPNQHADYLLIQQQKTHRDAASSTRRLMTTHSR